MLKRSAIFVHRWLGVALCLFFLVWFPSGIGMMYWDFPSVSAADRLARSSTLDPSAIRLSPAEAYATLAQSRPPAQVRLNTFDGRPVYRFRAGRMERVVYADTGAAQVEVSNEMMARIASAWVGQPANGAAREAVDVDQWTVQGSYRSLAPLWKYSWPTGEHVYVSQISGEVVQYTTTASRIGAYLGPIPHWLYFTPLRKHQPQWSRVVIWSSGIGTVAAILGLTIGIWMYSPSKRYRYAGVATGIPYSGQKRWHAVLGLIFGVGAATWAFSGLLSMDPFPAVTETGGAAADGPGAEPGIPQALRGLLSMAAFAAMHPREALSRMANLDVRELELTSVAGEPFFIATLASGDTRMLAVAGQPRTGFDRRRIIEIVKAAELDRLGDVRELDQYDRYYLDRRRHRPLPVVLARLNDAEQTRYYIDPKTARIVGMYSSRNRFSRWLYHGLHSLDFPWLYNHRPAWDIVVILFMAGGTALAATGLVLAWRVVRRSFGGAPHLEGLSAGPLSR